MAPSLSRATSARCRGFQSGRSLASCASSSVAARAPSVKIAERERIVGSNSPAILRQQENRGELWRLFQNFEQRVGRLFHEGRTGKDIHALPRLGGTVVNALNDVTNLVHLDHHLRRIGRDDEQVGMRLHENSRLFLVGLAQILAGLDRLGETRVQILQPSRCVCSSSSVHRSRGGRRWSLACRPLQAIHSAGQHERERVLAGSMGARKNDRMREVIAREHLAQARGRFPELPTKSEKGIESSCEILATSYEPNIKNRMPRLTLAGYVSSQLAAFRSSTSSAPTP